MKNTKFDNLFYGMSMESAIEVIDGNANIIDDATRSAESIGEMVSVIEQSGEEPTTKARQILDTALENILNRLELYEEFLPSTIVENDKVDEETSDKDGKGWLAKTKDWLVKLWEAIKRSVFEFIGMVKAFYKRFRTGQIGLEKALKKLKENAKGLTGMPGKDSVTGPYSNSLFVLNAQTIGKLIPASSMMESIDGIGKIRLFHSKFLNQFSNMHSKLDLATLMLDEERFNDFSFDIDDGNSWVKRRGEKRYEI